MTEIILHKIETLSSDVKELERQILFQYKLFAKIKNLSVEINTGDIQTALICKEIFDTSCLGLEDSNKCWQCGGSGEIELEPLDGPYGNKVKNTIPCHDCNGVGFV